MLDRLKELGWKKVVGYSLVLILTLVIVFFIVLFGVLLLLDTFDPRNPEPDAYQAEDWEEYPWQ